MVGKRLRLRLIFLDELLRDSPALAAHMDLADVLGAVEERGRALPMRLPASADRGEALAALGPELVQGQLGGLGCRGLAEAPQLRGSLPLLLPADALEAVAEHARDAQLRFGLRVDRLDGLGQAGQAVHAAYQDAGYAPALQLGEDVQPELGALAPGGPHPQRLPATLHRYRQGQADRPVGDLALAPRLGHGRVEVDDRVRPLQRPRLPLLDLLGRRLGGAGDEHGRDLHLVHPKQALLDVPDRQAPRAPAHDRLAEAVEAALPLRSERRLELALAVPGNLDRKLPVVAAKRLAAAPAADVPAIGPGMLPRPR